MYGVDMPPERRQQVIKKHGERGPDGKYVNVGWPNYVKGIGDDEIARWRRDAGSHGRHAGAHRRADQDSTRMCSPSLNATTTRSTLRPSSQNGYASTWAKRPRPSSADGCCLAWKRTVFALDKEADVGVRRQV